MRILLFIVAMGGAFSGLVEPFLRESNSEIATEDARSSWEAGEDAAAASAYSEAWRLRPGPATAFNAGTSKIAAGESAEGIEILGTLLDESGFAAPAHFNRGNAALTANEFDRAIEEYEKALRIDPESATAKRNLEIALRRRENQQQQPSPSSGDGDGEDQPRPAEGQDQRPDLPEDLQSLLRSVEQQEQEELRRMRQSQRRQGTFDW